MKKRVVYMLCFALIMLISCTALAEGEWSCPSCGTEALSGKFCPECGSPRPSQDWVCPNCGRTNQKQYCPDCGASRVDRQSSATATPLETEDSEPSQEELQPLSLGALMTPEQVVGIMNAGIAVVSEQFASANSLDTAALFEACALTDSESTPEILSYANEKWDVELYFYYPEESEPDPQTEAKHWCIAVKGTNDRANMLRSIVFSATLTVLKQVDPQLDGDAAVEMLLKQEAYSQYLGNGFLITYLTTEDGDDTQLMIERT